MSKVFNYGVIVKGEFILTERWVCLTYTQVRDLRRLFNSCTVFEVYQLKDYIEIDNFIKGGNIFEYLPVAKSLWNVSRETLKGVE